MTIPVQTRADCLQQDAHDSLASLRDQYTLPPNVIYLDGNSLGALPVRTPERLQSAILNEWGTDLIRSWNSAGWYEMPRRIGNKLAQLIGANAGEVVVADSTSINLFKVLSAALRLNPERNVILSEPDNFPTDLYITQGLIDQLGGRHTLQLENAANIPAAITEKTAVVLLTQVNYRTGYLHDMAALTQLAHENGALVIWDLAHSAGALPVDLNAAQADFAIGCGYKYLNGGPGAPAFLFVAERHQARFSQPLSGWMGHAAPFNFDPYYQPAEGVARYLCGTQAVLSMTALECGVDTLLLADMQQLRAKSLALTQLFIQLVEEQCAGAGLECSTPRAAAQRGSQVSFRHPHGYAIMQALIERGIIGDFRSPDILRFGFAPSYLRFVDVWDAAAALADILRTNAWQAARFQQRAFVT